MSFPSGIKNWGTKGLSPQNKLYGENALVNRYPKDTTLKNPEVHAVAKTASVKNCQQNPG